MESKQVRVLTRKRIKRHVPFQDNIKYLSKEETKRLLSIIDNIRDKIIIKLMYSTGMRVGEITKIQYDDIDFLDHKINIPAQNTKSKRARVPRVNKAIMNELKAYTKNERISRGLVFPISIRRIQYIIKTYGKKVELEWITPHKLRHTHIVHSLMSGVPVSAVQKQVGHVDLRTTQIYANISISDVKEAYEKAGVDF